MDEQDQPGGSPSFGFAPQARRKAETACAASATRSASVPLATMATPPPPGRY
jgi:hypothetical protein